MQRLLHTLTAVAMLAASACADGTLTPTPTPPDAAVTAITIRSDTPVGSMVRLTATAGLSDGGQLDVTHLASWQTSDPTIATVEPGVLRVVGDGDVEVRASFREVIGTLRLRVAHVDVTSIDILGTPSRQRFQLRAVAQLRDGTTADITDSAEWNTSDWQVATVSTTGVVTVARSGQVDVRVNYLGVTAIRSLRVEGAQQFSVSGIVRSSVDDEPIGGALVRILNGRTPLGTTDEDGRFVFTDVPSGRLIIEVVKDGFDVWSSDIVVDQDEMIVVRLVPLAVPTQVRGVAAPDSFTLRSASGTDRGVRLWSGTRESRSVHVNRT